MKKSSVLYTFLQMLCFSPSILLAESLQGTFSSFVVEAKNTTPSYGIVNDNDIYIKLNINKLSKKELPEIGEKVVAQGKYKDEFNFHATSISRALTKARNIRKENTSNNAPNNRKIILMRTKDSACSEDQIKRLGRELQKKGLELSNEFFTYKSDLNQDGAVDFFNTSIETRVEDCTNPEGMRNKAVAAKLELEKSGVHYLPSGANYSIALFTNNICKIKGNANFKGSFAVMHECSLNILLHELGHNQGLGHASIDENSDNRLLEKEEYADVYCFMGSADSKNHSHNPVHLDMLGWLGKSDVKTVSAKSSGDFRVKDISNSLSKANGAPKTLKITGSEKNIYISHQKKLVNTWSMLSFLQIHQDNPSFSYEEIVSNSSPKRSLLINSLLPRQSIKIENNMWISFEKIQNGIAKFRLSNKKEEGFEEGMGEGMGEIIEISATPYSALTARDSYVQRYNDSIIIYPFDPGLPFFQASGKEVNIYYPDGQHKTKEIKEIRAFDYGKHDVDFAGASHSYSSDVGDVIFFRKGSEVIPLSVRGANRGPRLKLVKLGEEIMLLSLIMDM